MGDGPAAAPLYPAAGSLSPSPWMSGHRGGVQRLVEPQLTTAGDLHRGDEPPALVAYRCRELDALALQFGPGLLDVVAHQVELVVAGGLARVSGQLGRRELEDRPAAAGFDVVQVEDVAQERADGFGVFAEHDGVDAPDAHESAGKPSMDTWLCFAS